VSRCEGFVKKHCAVGRQGAGSDSCWGLRGEEDLEAEKTRLASPLDGETRVLSRVLTRQFVEIMKLVAMLIAVLDRTSRRES
jgi:hypothetical protein